MGIWQIIWVVLVSIAFGIEAVKHGQPKEGNHNVWLQLISILITVGILYMGGFFG